MMEPRSLQDFQKGREDKAKFFMPFRACFGNVFPGASFSLRAKPPLEPAGAILRQATLSGGKDSNSLRGGGGPKQAGRQAGAFS